MLVPAPGCRSGPAAIPSPVRTPSAAPLKLKPPAPSRARSTVPGARPAVDDVRGTGRGGPFGLKAGIGPGAPIATSGRPSPLRSPAEATDAPAPLPVWGP